MGGFVVQVVLAAFFAARSPAPGGDFCAERIAGTAPLPRAPTGS